MASISKDNWQICRICGAKITDLAKEFGGSGTYHAQVFRRHIRIAHDISLEDYFTQYCGLARPICQCGICKQPVKVVGTSNLRWGRYVCGRNNGVQRWSEEAKLTRKGANNPAFGKPAWHKGLTKDTSQSLKQVSQKLTGKPKTSQHKQELSKAARRRVIHGHSGCRHSPETIEKLRQHTLQMIADGRYNHTETKPQRTMRDILIQLGIEHEIEKIVGVWVFDFYLPDYNIYIEVDGDYFHSNPLFFPNGPTTKTQKVNWLRDKKKNAYCALHGMILWRFWEYDILHNTELIKEQLNAIN
jgi:very-short-patch-repair endonuclease